MGATDSGGIDMKNIFENACFGKQYKTRDGSKAIFICQRTDNSLWDLNHPYACVVEGLGERNYFPNGQLYIGENFVTENDIVSEWKEPINEEELDELADAETWRESDEFNCYIDDILALLDSCKQLKNIYRKGSIWAFKAGYRKAKEE